MKNKGQNQKLFLKNFPLKLLGFVLAVLLWLVLNNTQDPVITSSVSVPITYEEGGLAEKNMVQFQNQMLSQFQLSFIEAV